jgi:hypothetical protein
MLTRTILTAALAAFAFTPAAQADTYGHIEILAHQLDRYASRLDQEFALHYRHSPQYAHLKSDAREMARVAEHVHEVAHAHGSIAHLESDLRQLDRLFHHIEDLVDDVELHSAHGGYHGYHNRFGSYHGGGHAGHGGEVRRLMHAIEDTLHHLHSDVRELLAAQRAPQGPVVGNPGYGRYPSVGAYPGFGGGYSTNPGPVIRFSRPGFSITLGR